MYSLQDLVALTNLNIQQSVSSIHLTPQSMGQGLFDSLMKFASGAGPEVKGLNTPFLAAGENTTQELITPRSICFSALLYSILAMLTF